MMLYKTIGIQDHGKEPSEEEIEILIKSLKPGMKLPLLNNYGYPDHYYEQLTAEHCLNELLEGHKLEFVTTRSVKAGSYLKMNERLTNIIMTTTDVIKRRGLDLNFEYGYYSMATKKTRMMVI